MYSLFDFIIKWKDHLITLLLIVISINLISNSNTTKISGFKTWLYTNSIAAEYLVRGSGNTKSLKNENKALRNMNLQLSQELIKNRKAKYENEKLRSIIGFKETFETEIEVAEVIGRNNFNGRVFLTLNIGNNDSIKIGMPVRTDTGLIGVISEISDNFSVVETILNQDIKVSVKDIRSEVNGIFEWDGRKNYFLKNIPETYDVKQGDILVTSNYSNKYPPAIPVGRIKNVETDLSSIFLNIEVESFVDMYLVSEVFILKFLPDPERVELIQTLKNFQKDN